MLDALLRFALTSLSWFPRLVKQVKGITIWNRNSPTELGQILEAAGKPGAASLIRSSSPPHFAKWRWTTFHDVLVSLGPSYEILKGPLCHFHRCLAKRRDKIWAKTVTACLESSSFRREFEFSHWLAETITGLERCLGSCDCNAFHNCLERDACQMQ